MGVALEKGKKTKKKKLKLKFDHLMIYISHTVCLNRNPQSLICFLPQAGGKEGYGNPTKKSYKYIEIQDVNINIITKANIVR